ncbi:hypothetical protein Q5P01_013184 [Channa striata]|uniref:Uncharacterized protein n=1 Tax=Channa striata TaxID=64152 RepID=A0AA88SK28_CHASR|nr:hypothetical protein Q5P01_013184 [Channa striata]
MKATDCPMRGEMRLVTLPHSVGNNLKDQRPMGGSSHTPPLDPSSAAVGTVGLDSSEESINEVFRCPKDIKKESKGFRNKETAEIEEQGPHSLRISSSGALSLPSSAAFLRKVVENPAGRICQEDNDHRSSLQSFFLTDIIIVLHKQIQWSTATSAQGVPLISSENEEASVVTAMCPSGCPVCRTCP